ncbi:ribonuclease 3-like [Typha angustifolia]|uniref:ribonuclease 3-like n=1 Tax=Typha angustifolia TaxID=59011 RepID=UPI003C2DEAF2
MVTSKVVPLICCLAFFCLSSSLISAAESDFFYLTLLWPGASCNGFHKDCCTPTTGEPAEDFFVQALETYDSATGKIVTNCNSTCPFFINQLRELIDDLFAYWPDIKCPSNNGMNQWKSVWCTYGSCSNLTEVQYFQQALALRGKVDLLNTLTSNGVVPSETTQYNLEDIQRILIAYLGFSTEVECRRSLLRRDYELYKIRICVSSDGQRIISCPISMSKTCGSKIKFLPFSTNMLHDEGADDKANPLKMPSDKSLVM